jgi:isoquinoline 1-oxidoreductase subunit beta
MTRGVKRASEPVDAGRRAFLVTASAAGGGLLIGVAVPVRAAILAATGGARAPGELALNPWVRIGADGTVTIIVSQAEIGQGISTTLPAILADELGADWSRVRLETAPYDKAYQNPRVNWMFTGNSESVQAFHDLMRKTGAGAREMLVRAAARRWAVEPSSCRTENGFVIHASTKRRLGFGEVAADAAKLEPPRDPVLKPAGELKLVGRSLARVDVPEKVDGSAIFGIDFKLPGMLLAAVRTAPAIGGGVKRFDEAAAKAMPGVRAVVPVQNGVAVVADTWWQARTALAAMPIEFDAGPNGGLDSAQLAARYRERLENGPFVTPVKHGEPDAALRDSKRMLAADYESPFLAHATMEPMNCTARVTPERCEIWAPTQGQELAFYALKGVLGLPDDRIAVNRTPYAGGGFGRRLVPDFVVQAALIAKAVGRPVKTIWDREEDMRRDLFRPATMVRLAAALDDAGMPQALYARVVSPTVLLPVFPPIAEVLKEQKLDPTAMEGMLEWPYEIAHRKVDFHLMEVPIPTSVLRTTGYGPNVFALESFIDELASMVKTDPYRYRRRLLAGNARALRVLDRAAQLADWGRPLPQGAGRGIAFAEAFGTLIAQVAEVAVSGDELRVRRVVSVVDCGRVLDPGIAAAGIEGGVVFGLAGCKSEITFKDGRVVEDNYQRYAMPHLAETPRLVTEFVASGGKLGGVGEVSPVTVPAALANAIFAATGKRLRSLPVGRHGLQFA